MDDHFVGAVVQERVAVNAAAVEGSVVYDERIIEALQVALADAYRCEYVVEDVDSPVDHVAVNGLDGHGSGKRVEAAP
jgi:hypothetical protein